MNSLGGGRNDGVRRTFAARALGFLRRKLTSVFGPRVYSAQRLPDSGFLRLLNLPPGDSASDLHDGDGVTALLRHFEARSESRWLALPKILTDLRLDTSHMTAEEIVTRADSALTGDLHPSGVRPRMTGDGHIDWSSNPTSNREWLLMLHRHAWWALWGAAYQLTGDEKYAQAFVRQMLDWIARHPLPGQIAEHHEPWRLMEVGLRMRVSWIPAFGCFYQSLAFDDAAKLKMLRALYDHGQFLNKFHTNRNHLVRESNGLITLALYFPEFTSAKEWLASGLTRLDEELRAQLNSDGSHIEMSVGYQWLTIDEFEVTRSLLAEHELKLPESDLDEALRRMYEFLAAVIRPDRTFPQLNDGFILWDAARLETTAAKSGWSEIEFIGSGGVTGLEPRYRSASFPNAGVHVMRSDWGGDALYLIADTGPYGGPHGHEDKLSFELFAHGAPFIVDPGSYTYEKSDPFRNYFVGSQGHNTVLVDNRSQVRRWNSQHLTPEVQNDRHGAWESNSEYDFASGKYAEGYAPFSLVRPENVQPESDVVHQRDFLFVKPEYWIVVDYLHASTVHDYQFLFHFAPDVNVESISESGALVQSGRNGARLIIRAITEESLASELIAGSEAPVQGWYSSDHHVKCPAPALVFNMREANSACIAWLLYPLDAAQSAERIDVNRSKPESHGLLEFSVNRGAEVDSCSIRFEAAVGKTDADLERSRIVVTRGNQQSWSVGSGRPDQK